MVQIHTPESTNANNSIARSSTANEVDNSANRAIELEKLISLTESEIRKEIFNHIICNTRIENQSSKHILYGVGGMLLGCLLTCVYSIIPVHNVITNQEYWYELPLQIVFSFLPIGAANITCLLYTSPSPRDLSTSRMPSSA